MPTNYKRFEINTIADALLALGSLVSASISNLEKFDQYTTEAMELLLVHEQDELVDAVAYEDINDKSLFRQFWCLSL